MSPWRCTPATNSLREKLGSPPAIDTRTPTRFGSRSTAKAAMAPRLKPVLDSAVGKGNAAVAEPIIGSEDFSYFIAQGVPSFFFGLGGADPQKYAQAKAAGEYLPSNHSSVFAPDLDPALRTGIAAEVAVLRNLLTGSAGELRKSTQQQSRSSQ